jgi:hypothetical protein
LGWPLPPEELWLQAWATGTGSSISNRWKLEMTQISSIENIYVARYIYLSAICVYVYIYIYI